MSNNAEEKELLKIGEIAEKAGLPIPTIRHYTKLGLLKVSAYTDGGQYLYDGEDTLEAIKYISELSSRGIKLSEIKEKFSNKKSSKNIIIIESDSAYARFLKSVMGHICPLWHIKAAKNAFDAGHMLVDILPDMVVLNMSQPELDGKRICGFIKTNTALMHTKVIALTENEETEEKILKSNPDAIIPKSADVEKFMKLVKKVLRL